MPAPKTRREWKASEVKFLKANYPDKGGAWCAERLKRPVAAIHAKAVKLCLRRSHNANGRVESNPVIDAAIRHAYTKPADSGAIKQICKTFGVSSPWVARRGLEIGARTMRPPRRTWQPRELEIVEKNAQASAEQIAKALRAAGFRRSAAAVQAVKTANHFDAAASEVLRPGDIAKLFGVVPNAVKGWIKKGMLVPENPAREPGEFTIIREEAVARFIVEHPLAVNFPKLEGSKLWFIDLLVRKGALAAMSKPKSQREAVLQAAQAHPAMSPRQIAELLEMDVRVARVVISKLRSDGLLPSTREAA